jgi:hypothetical protein
MVSLGAPRTSVYAIGSVRMQGPGSSLRNFDSLNFDSLGLSESGEPAF